MLQSSLPTPRGPQFHSFSSVTRFSSSSPRLVRCLSSSTCTLFLFRLRETNIPAVKLGEHVSCGNYKTGRGKLCSPLMIVFAMGSVKSCGMEEPLRLMYNESLFLLGRETEKRKQFVYNNRNSEHINTTGTSIIVKTQLISAADINLIEITHAKWSKGH